FDLRFSVGANGAALERRKLRADERRATPGTVPSVALAVPAADDADLALEAEDRERAGVESQAAAEGRGLLDPAGRQRPQDMAVGDQRDVTRGAARLLDHAVDAAADVVGGLAARAAVTPEVPVGPLLPDLRRRDPLVGAV